MDRLQAAKLTREELDKHGLTDWHVRLVSNESGPLGICMYKDKCIILNALHIDIHPDPEIKETVLHEIAHAIVGPFHGHDEVWQAKARELGCQAGAKCNHLELSPEIIDAIRSGADVKIEFETEVIHKPKYTVSRLQDKCETCGKVAREAKNTLIELPEPSKHDMRIIVLECGHHIVKQIPKGTPFHAIVSNSYMPHVRDCAHEWDKNRCIKCREFRPFPFQVEGMRFIEAALAVNRGVGIFDEMGLGKTIQALGWLFFHPEAFPVLAMVKSGIKFQWLKEVLRWLGPKYLPQVIQGSNDYLIPQLQMYICSYDLLTPKVRNRNGKQINQGFDISKFKERGIKTVLLDECQQIKNPDATRTQMIRRVVKECDAKVIPLSGTPWENRGSELFTVLNMMAPYKFPSYQGFARRWVDYYYRGNSMKEAGIRNIEAFREYTKDIMIRRQRIEVMPELPLVNRTKLFTELDNISQEAYDGEVSDFVKWWNQILVDEEENTFETQTNLLAKLARMRHITGLAKIPATLDWVEEFVEETDRKLIIFVHHKDVLAIILQQCREKFSAGENTIPILHLPGGMSAEEKFRIQEEFNSSSRAILIASTRSSGEGLNLQTCSDCVMHERQWNPSKEEQAEGRMIRIGQVSNFVNAVYTTATGTVDDYMDDIVEPKRVSFHRSMDKGEAAPSWNEHELRKELANTIVSEFEKKQGHSKIKKLASV